MTCPLTVNLTPIVLSASATTPPPLTVNVNSPTPLVIDITPTTLDISLLSEPIAVTVATVGVQGPSGAPGAGGADAILTATTAQAISGHFVVTINDSGLMDYASANDSADVNRPLALTEGAWASDMVATAVMFGVVMEGSWSWTPGVPIWLGDNGLPTQTLPGDAVFQREVAEVINATTIFISPRPPIALS